MTRISGWHDDQPPFAALLGKTLTSIEGKKGGDQMIFETADGEQFALYHSQDCCESVAIEDVVGDLSDLIGEPLVEAEEVSSERGEPKPEYPDSWTWTFYKLGTRKGSVTVRWLGESNGYYSESVTFARMRALPSQGNAS